jgi:hypothetical protein
MLGPCLVDLELVARPAERKRRITGSANRLVAGVGEFAVEHVGEMSAIRGAVCSVGHGRVAQVERDVSTVGCEMGWGRVHHVGRVVYVGEVKIRAVVFGGHGQCGGGERDESEGVEGNHCAVIVCFASEWMLVMITSVRDNEC